MIRCTPMTNEIREIDSVRARTPGDVVTYAARMAERTKPAIAIPDGNPPAILLIEDVEMGDGGEAVAGSAPVMHYVGASWSTGREFDASWDRGQTFSFKLGAGQVIRGWDEGIAGMKVGGRRRLTIPPDLGYGAAGAGGVIAPNETLVFVVDLIDVRTGW